MHCSQDSIDRDGGEAGGVIGQSIRDHAKHCLFLDKGRLVQEAEA